MTRPLDSFTIHHGATSRSPGLFQSFFLLALRVYLAEIFLLAGLLKIQSWETTLTLFEYEYEVPVLSPVLAAWLGTVGELVLPALLVLGLAGRFAAAGLFTLNLVALISYPDISAAGIKDHMLWGWMSMALLIFGCGRVSLDNWLVRRRFTSALPAQTAPSLWHTLLTP